MNKNCLSYWYQIIRDVVPTPRTIIIKTELDMVGCVYDQPPEGIGKFVEELSEACAEIGYPCFMRTGQGSGKHIWDDACFVRSRENLEQHVANLVEWSMLVDLIGLETDVFVVREMLPTKPVAVLPAYKNMPLCREFRCFVNDGVLECLHPYWPRGAAEDGFGFGKRILPENWDSVYNDLCSLNEVERAEVERLAVTAGERIGGRWSIDILDTERGWFVTDMAEAERSYHWPECPSQKNGGVANADV